jgi:predicted transcriptional regulator
MTLEKIVTLIDARLLTGEENLSVNFHSACGADLMSDVLAFAKDRGVLLTGLINPQVIRTAEMMDIKAVVFVRGKTPTDEIVEFAKGKGMSLLTTKHPMYIACGLLFSNGLRAGEEN